MVLTALIMLTLNINSACLDTLNTADIVLETVEYDDKINGRVDFVGVQKPWEWNFKSGERNVLLHFIDKLDTQLREKMCVTQSFDRQWGIRCCLFPFWTGRSSQFLFQYQEPVNDKIYLPTCLYLDYYYKPGNNKMTGAALSQIKKYSDADYFLLIAIRPGSAAFFGYQGYKNEKVTVALLTIVYNRRGKKIYSKIYKETLDVGPLRPLIRSNNFRFYDCTMKLIENQGEQISKDLEFLLTADDAPSPTLEDLHKRLQQPGTIDDDVKFLKEFQRK